MAKDRQDTALHATIIGIIRDDRGRLLAALIRSLGDFDLAEDALSDAVESALVHWSRNGLPNSPQGWLLQVARRRAIDRLRRGQRFSARVPDIEMLMEEEEETRNMPEDHIPDERLRLIFTCCHPAIEEKTRIALTLRSVCGLTTREIARAFLDTDIAMGQRLSRAKAKITTAGIPFSIPERSDWDARRSAVLTVIYLIYNEGWTAGAGEAPIRDTLCDEAIYLCRLLNDLAPHDPEIEGLLALLLLMASRRKARLRPGFGLLSLEEQDRSLWDHALIDKALRLLDDAVGRQAPGPFQCQAAIQALHSEATSNDETDWPQILLLYDRLYRLKPSSVVRLNRAIALLETGDIRAAQSELEDMRSELEAYQPYHAADAEIATRAGDLVHAKRAYGRAIELSQSEDERRWLAMRRGRLN